MIKPVHYLVSLGLLALPAMSLASTQLPGAGSVYLNDPNGADELIVNNFNDDLNLNFDIYQSDTPNDVNSWTLDRSYTSSDYSNIDSDHYYSYGTQPAVRFNGDYYFTVNVQSAGEYSTLPVSIQIWRVTKRGGKPAKVLEVAGVSSSYLAHQSVLVLNDQLVYMGPDGVIYTSDDGEIWTEGTALEGNVSDAVSNGNKIYVSLDDVIYSSTDLITWTNLENPCGNGDTCYVTQLTLRPNKGIIALTATYGETTSYLLWAYKHGSWSVGSSLNHGLSALQTFGDHVYAIRSRGNNGYHYSVAEVMPDGTYEDLSERLAGSGMGLFTKKLLLINPKNASYVVLRKY